MVEQKLEKKIMDKLKSMLTQLNITNISVVGSWQTGTNDSMKGLEPDGIDGVVTVKMNPRKYDTYTTPDANMVVDFNLAVRADVDYNGLTYLDVNEKFFNILQSWQKEITTCQTDFDIQNEFETSGVVINGGDISLDKENVIWSCTQQITIFGYIIQ